MTQPTESLSQTAPDLATEDRIMAVLRRLGISRAHFAGRAAVDWSGMAQGHPEAVASLSLVCPLSFDPATLASVASRLLVFRGDSGPAAEMAERNLTGLPEATLVTLAGYRSPDTYADVIVEHGDDIGEGMAEFLAKIDGGENGVPAFAPPQTQGEEAGIFYQVRGSGPPLALLPLGAAPSQWDPLLSRLARTHSVITLSGPQLGMVGTLEARGRSSGYLGAVSALMDQARVEPGDKILEVGCGTGVLVRWLVRRSGGRNPVVGVDVNRFFLREAAALVRSEGLEGGIELREGSAESLPLDDNSVDVAMSSTVIQRVDAARMMAEMLRVTKPGGRVAVLGHAHDMNRWVNAPLPPSLKAKIESPPWAEDTGVPHGCADADLYRLFNGAGLSKIVMFPHLATYTDAERLQNLQYNILSGLNGEEAEEWRTAVAQAEAEGSYFISTPFHCAVGVKP